MPRYDHDATQVMNTDIEMSFFALQEWRAFFDEETGFTIEYQHLLPHFGSLWAKSAHKALRLAAAGAVLRQAVDLVVKHRWHTKPMALELGLMVTKEDRKADIYANIQDTITAIVEEKYKWNPFVLKIEVADIRTAIAKVNLSNE